jgi:hypothetical protein
MRCSEREAERRKTAASCPRLRPPALPLKSRAAIEDALSSLGVTLAEHPVSPQRLVELIGKSRE